MKIRIVTTIIALLVCCGCFAATLTPDVALKRITRENTGIRKINEMKTPRLMKTICDSEGNALIYIFTYSENRGFMILSADDNVMPLLGYSDEGEHNVDDMPPAMEAWLQNYALQISEIQGDPNKAVAKAPRRVERESIPYMVKTTWNQGYPYNRNCPPWEEGGFTQHSVVGCVGLAVAQMASYWRYPSKGYGYISYCWYNETRGPTLELDADAIYIDWNYILNSYSGTNPSDAQLRELNKLTQLCSYAVYSDFGPNTTGARADKITERIIEYLGYSDCATLDYRSDHESQEEWEDMLYESLKNYGPIIYSGYQGFYGHCFIMDGYDSSTQKFHFNWGWGGSYNGHYNLQTLSVGGYNFSWSQHCTYNLRPADPEITPVSIKIDGVCKDELPIVPQKPDADDDATDEETETQLIGEDEGTDSESDNEENDTDANEKVSIPTYEVEDLSNVDIEFEFEMTKGLLNSPITLKVFETDPDSGEIGQEIVSEILLESITMQLGSEVIMHTLSIPATDALKNIYTVTLNYQNIWDNEPRPFSMFKVALFGEDSGVDSITSETNAEYEYYNLQGISIQNPRAGEIILRKTGNKVEKIIY